ncbi:hypothetical protein ACOMCU_27985 [Lysinibacillus sp. UGB7]|uniref:hypothetical protein n=1 Tax=Lysinibacillus sp. UGB7 TaxID=3411039 RepID=UPI003B780934
MKTMQGLCMDSGNSTNLQNGDIYYLFPHGGQAFNVSRFPRKGSHFGTYQKDRFKIVEDEDKWPQEPVKPNNQQTLEKGKVYKAELVWRSKGYAESTQPGTYFIAAVNNCYVCKTDCYFYLDAERQQPKGRFPLHWFTNIQEYDENAVVELPRNEWRQMNLFGI